jgi:uncharacterized protein
MGQPFVWYELMTPEPEAAARFYADVVGWAVDRSSFAGLDYTLLKTAGREIAGVMATPPDAAGMPPMWFGYIGVDDVDAAAAVATAAGAAIHKGPGDIPGVGRFAVVADPQGAMFMLFRGNREAMEPLPYMTPGTIGWHELHTSDWEAAWAFYSGQFGWAQGAQMAMGPTGTYQMYRIGRDFDEGAMLTDTSSPHRYWAFYFSVPGIAEAKARIEAGGGSVLMGPHEVPGGRWIVIANDPQGGTFALVGPEHEAAR